MSEIWSFINGIDVAITRFLNITCATETGDFVMKAISTLGAWHVLFAISVLIIYFHTKEKFWRCVVELSVTLLLTAIIVQLMKQFINRPRPMVNIEDVRVLVERVVWWSFPSGHSAGAFAAATYLAMMLKKHQSAFFLVAAMIAISRVYLAVHYPSDIIAGSIIGVITSVIVLRMIERNKKSEDRNKIEIGRFGH